MTHNHLYTPRKVEKATAVGSFIAATAFAFTSLMISEQHAVSASNCTVIAQFLLLTASIFGIDYHVTTLLKNSQQKENSDGKEN